MKRKMPTRTLPQEEAGTQFTNADLRILGDLSVSLGMLHWQNDVGSWSNQVARLLLAQEKLNDLVALLLSRSV